MTEEKKAQILIRFHSANKIDNYNGGEAMEKRGKKPKESTEQNIRIIFIFIYECIYSYLIFTYIFNIIFIFKT